MQCQNGAYLSEADDELIDIIFTSLKDKSYINNGIPNQSNLMSDVSTAESLNLFKSRRGQAEFSKNIRLNYSSKCCFPECNISDHNFLVGSHIARWADAPHLRGEISNGLCLCLMHDKAFEQGYFTLDRNLCISVNPQRTNISPWVENFIFPHDGKQINVGAIKPSQEAIEYHWKRIAFTPPNND